ncbi:MULTISPECIES: GNAT family N-acetyltransferase [Paracoccus]|jgi:GNAT superfamily N-acetyltransferase|uniref:GCN5-related N-acetyltransferase n=1 Tax=Paracoccus denitrificans (strain Pd 1222) TaxID=318586 RepID=A1BBZ1_PARDP|nr:MULTISPECIES: GNAT family N-acetyltransferase [Paracoccus]ABL73035.1 GCN5-related N-acetyltransferase [Paracoccus denitrificans PD1222]MBB4628411.1 GNAT superfamily N-acetyltransferase [Paracoccus denitrificans]MCU7429623.1 GNAT family N-acetyltransferase [Paracoccus denitrificans]MDK8873787.1 GNAT family N-acetyltransferase [Paracoccus sp. SSJ]QAR29428.1 N-acetyltransferase [Paracoccus denitrificans]
MTITPPDIAPVAWRRADGYLLTTDRASVDVDLVGRFLAEEAYWSDGLPRDRLERALAGSLPMAVIAPDGAMAGFARLVTDYTVFAYLRDVFVLPAHRGRGLAVWLARVIRTHPELADIPTWMLATRDAHAVYEKAGFRPVPHPEFYMSVPKPGS